MNKQATAFLTMFSLILMLSVYYVTLPNDGEVVVLEEEREQEEVMNQADENTNEDMQSTITSKQEEELYKHNSVISDTESSEEEKQNALNTIEQMKANMQIQQQIQETLTVEGFQSAIEIDGDICKVVILESEDTAENANLIMKKAYEVSEGRYFIEVSFK